MGVSYVWVCDERKEYMDPYPLNGSQLFTWMQADHIWPDLWGHPPEGCPKRGWNGCTVRLVSDGGGTQDEYYSITSRDDEEASVWSGPGPYRDVTEFARWFDHVWWEDKATDFPI